MFERYVFPLMLGCVPLLLNCFVERWRKQARTKSRRLYLLLRVCNIFELFALRSLEAYEEIENYVASNGCAGNKKVHVPAVLDDFPDDVDWKSVSPELANEILSVNNYLVDVTYRLDSMWDYIDDPEDYDPVRRRHAFLTGHKVWKLAQKLREITQTTSSLDERVGQSFDKIKKIEMNRDKEYQEYLMIRHDSIMKLNEEVVKHAE